MIRFSTVIVDFEDKPILDDVAMQSNGGVPVELTLGRAARHALCLPHQEDRDVNGSEKFRRASLAYDIASKGDQPLKSEDVALIKRLIGRLYNPIVVFRAFPLLDPAEQQ